MFDRLLVVYSDKMNLKVKIKMVSFQYLFFILEE